MKASEIAEGARYTDGLGRVREVKRVWEGGFYQPKKGRFRMLVEFTNPPSTQIHVTGLTEFARWAKQRVEERGSDESK